MANTVTATADAAADAAVRHPLDPEPVRSTKAAAVLALGVAAVVTGPLLGGIIPATVGLTLARQARTEIVASQGYLTGARQLRIGLVMAWVGIGLAIAALVVASIVGIIALANGSGGQDFPATSN
jgi:(hydroxyamino)benzene mutase